MKLLLSSLSINRSQSKELLKLLGKDSPEEVSLALIENAADNYSEDKKDWVYEHRQTIVDNGFNVELIDLRGFSNAAEVQNELSNFDVVWFGGGNVFYLRWLLADTGSDEVIVKLAKSGKVIGGGSAGAIVLCASIDGFQHADKPEQTPKLILDGLNLTSFICLPHWGNEKFGGVMQSIKEHVESSGYATIKITDEQAMIIEGGRIKVV